MSKASQLKDLADELRALFWKKTDEKSAYELLKKNPRFGSVRLAKVQSIYKQFRSQLAKTTNSGFINRFVTPFLPQFIEKAEQLSICNTIIDCQHEKHGCLANTSGKSLDARYHLYRNRTKINDYNFFVFDTFTDNIGEISIEKVQKGSLNNIYFLDAFYAILVERRVDITNRENPAEYVMSLVEFDWSTKQMHKHKPVPIRNVNMFFSPDIHVDTADSSKFLIKTRETFETSILQRCSIVDNEIEVAEERIEKNLEYDIVYSLFKGNLYGFKAHFDYKNRFDKAFIEIYDLNEDSELPFFWTKSLPKGVSAVFSGPHIVGCWANDHFYVAVKFDSHNLFGIMRMDGEEEWKLLEFCSPKPILNIKFVVDGSFLMIQTLDMETEIKFDEHQIQKTFYRIPLKTPDSLANLAWFALVRLKNKMPDIDLYAEVTRYLPYTSGIRCPFAE